MSEKEYSDVVVIEKKPGEASRLTISSHHVIKFLTFLKDKGIEANGQDAPFFGLDNFPTIYYIKFQIPAYNLLDEFKTYLKAEAISYIESLDENGNIKLSGFTKGTFS